MKKMSKKNVKAIFEEEKGSKMTFQRINNIIYPIVTIGHRDYIVQKRGTFVSEKLRKLYDQIEFGEYVQGIGDRRYGVVDKLILKGNKGFEYLQFWRKEGLLEGTIFEQYYPLMDKYQASLDTGDKNERSKLREECYKEIRGEKEPEGESIWLD